ATQKNHAVCAGPARIFVRKVSANVAQTGCAEQRVGDRVAQAVSVRMAKQPFVERDFDPAEDQPAAFDQAVNVMTQTDSERRRVNSCRGSISLRIVLSPGHHQPAMFDVILPQTFFAPAANLPAS